MVYDGLLWNHLVRQMLKKKQKIFEFFSLTLEDLVVETAAIAC